MARRFCHRSTALAPTLASQSTALGFLARIVTLGVLTALISPQPGRAHAIESTLVRVQALHNTLQLDTRFSTGAPVAGAQVRLVSPDGQQRLNVGQTDRLGGLRFQLPATASAAWEVQVDGGGGHRDYLELPAAPTAAPQASQPNPRRPRMDGQLPLGLMLLGVVSGGWIWIRRPR